MVKPVIDELRDNVVLFEDELINSEEELRFLRQSVKQKEAELKSAKSAVYKATKVRNELKKKLQKAKNKANTYLSQRRAWGKKNVGKVIAAFTEEDL